MLSLLRLQGSFRAGLGKVGLGGGRENTSIAVSCYTTQQNLVLCCSWQQRESQKKHKRLVFCFSPSSRKKQSKNDMEWTDIFKVCGK